MSLFHKKIETGYSDECLEDLTDLFNYLRKIVEKMIIMEEMEKSAEGTGNSTVYNNQVEYVRVYLDCVDNIWHRLLENTPDICSDILTKIDSDKIKYCDTNNVLFSDHINNAIIKAKAVDHVLNWIENIVEIAKIKEAAAAIEAADAEVCSIINRCHNSSSMRSIA